MLFCHDYLGGAAYKDIILKNHTPGFGAGFFDSEFGDCMPVAQALVKTGKCSFLRIQLTWSSTHTYGDADIPAITKKAQRWQTFALENPTIHIELSTFCEHHLSNPDKYHLIVGKNAPNCTVVNSPLKTGAISKIFKNEFHGAETRPRLSTTGANFSFDGTACVDADVTAFKNTYVPIVEALFFWDAAYNCHTEMGQSARNWKPTPELIQSIAYLSNNRGAVKLPAKWLWKSHSEQKGIGDPRADKPVLICPLRTSKILLKSTGGHLLETMTYYGTYTDGRYRYYGTQWGYQIAQHCTKLQGNGVCDVWANGKKIGTVNPAFRNAEFRA